MLASLEGENLHSQMRVRQAIEMAMLLVTPEDRAMAEASRKAYNAQVEKLLDKKISTGWRYTGNEAELQEIEDEASLLVEEQHPEFVQAFTKLNSLFNSLFVESSNLHG